MFGGLFRGRRGRRQDGPPASPPVAGDPGPPGWTALPALHPVSGPPPASVDSLHFVRTLATRSAIEPVLRPPAHDLVHDGGGVVRGLTSVVARHAEVTGPPVELQRSVSRTGRVRQALGFGGPAPEDSPWPSPRLTGPAAGDGASAVAPPPAPDASPGTGALRPAPGPAARRRVASPVSDAPPVVARAALLAAVPAPPVRSLPVPATGALPPSLAAALPPSLAAAALTPSGGSPGAADGSPALADPVAKEPSGSAGPAGPAGPGGPLPGLGAATPAVPAVQRSAASARSPIQRSTADVPTGLQPPGARRAGPVRSTSIDASTAGPVGSPSMRSPNPIAPDLAAPSLAVPDLAAPSVAAPGPAVPSAATADAVVADAWMPDTAPALAETPGTAPEAALQRAVEPGAAVQRAADPGAGAPSVLGLRSPAPGGAAPGAALGDAGSNDPSPRAVGADFLVGRAHAPVPSVGWPVDAPAAVTRTVPEVVLPVSVPAGDPTPAVATVGRRAPARPLPAIQRVIQRTVAGGAVADLSTPAHDAGSGPHPGLGAGPAAPPVPAKGFAAARVVSRTVAAPAYHDPGDVAVAAGIATRDADGAVVFAPPPAPPAALPVQRQEQSRPPAAAAPPPPATPATPAPPTVAVAPSVPAPAPDLAGMADELYERIERRLRTDLFLERERRGALADW